MTKRLLLDASSGLRISKPGKDAMADPFLPEDAIFDSDWYRTMPIHQIGSLSIAPGNTTVVFPTLPYTPTILVYFWDRNVTSPAATPTQGLMPTNTLRLINTDVLFTDDDPSGSGSLYRKNFSIRAYPDKITFGVGAAWTTKDVSYVVIRIASR